MIPLMIEAICGKGAAPQASGEIEQEVREYVDCSTGILTIRQMQWLAGAVQRRGFTRQVLAPGDYKAMYLSRLMVFVHERMARLASGECRPEELMVAGAGEFLRGLAERGLCCYLASGTDHADVLNEAGVLGLLPYFDGGVYGALDTNEDHAKERVIQRILEENRLSGSELLVIGDGPVEIREGAARGALTWGVASDETRRGALTCGVAPDETRRIGWNQRKMERLAQAGADVLSADFTHAAEVWL
jgi:beta-phosphoglucomutase-like phosphatase (HAD superfamily)